MPPLCYAVEAGRAQMGRQGTWKVATCIFVRLRQMHKKPKRAKCQQKSPASSTTSWNVDVISALGDSSRKKSYSSWWQTSRYFLMLGNFFSPIFHGFFRLFTGPSFFLKPPKASLQMARWGHQSRIRWGLVGWFVRSGQVAWREVGTPKRWVFLRIMGQGWKSPTGRDQNWLLQFSHLKIVESMRNFGATVCFAEDFFP